VPATSVNLFQLISHPTNAESECGLLQGASTPFHHQGGEGSAWQRHRQRRHRQGEDARGLRQQFLVFPDELRSTLSTGTHRLVGVAVPRPTVCVRSGRCGRPGATGRGGAASFAGRGSSSRWHEFDPTLIIPVGVEGKGRSFHARSRRNWSGLFIMA